MNEGPGHVPINMIEVNMAKQLKMVSRSAVLHAHAADLAKGQA
jgi:thiamine biosynthesis protein ThiC